MSNVINKLSKIGLVPVIKIDKIEDAKPLAKALINGGLPCAEVTFRTPCAKEAIQVITKEYPDMIVGAGTVLTRNQVDDAISAGAKFITISGLNLDIVKYCQEKGCPVVTGINNPTGIGQANLLGINTVKNLPAEQSGALNISSCGSGILKPEMIAKGDFDGIEKIVRQAVDAMLGFKFRHIGVNPCNDTAGSAANTLNKFFSFDLDENPKSIFVGIAFEMMKDKGPGTHGHVAIETNNVERAVYHLERRGVKFDYSTAMYNDSGAMKFIYIAEEINGFAYHLIQY